MVNAQIKATSVRTVRRRQIPEMSKGFTVQHMVTGWLRKGKERKGSSMVHRYGHLMP